MTTSTSATSGRDGSLAPCRVVIAAAKPATRAVVGTPKERLRLMFSDDQEAQSKEKNVWIRMITVPWGVITVI